MTGAQDSWAALWARPGYAGFYLTVCATRVVGFMFNTAGVLLILDRTGSAALAGAVGAAAVLPSALIGPVLGAWMDVAKRRRPLVVADQLCSGAALAGMIITAGHAPSVALLSLGVLLGITRPLSSGSYVGAMAALSGPQLLDRASTLEATSINLALVVGPALAAVLTATVGVTHTVVIEAAGTVLAAVAIAAQPAFEAQGPHRALTVAHAVREGTRALVRTPALRDIGLATALANMSWGLMLITFPVYAHRDLGAHRSAGGFLWAGLAVGSIVGTFALSRAPSRRRIARSYLALGLSGLLWALARSLPVGIALVVVSGVLEGPAYSGSMAIRQRYAPEAARAQVMTTMLSLGQVAMSAGSLVGGLLPRPIVAFAAFCLLNVAAAAVIGGDSPPAA